MDIDSDDDTINEYVLNAFAAIHFYEVKIFLWNFQIKYEGFLGAYMKELCQIAKDYAIR